MDAFGGLFLGTFITIVVVVLLLVVWKEVKKRLFPRENADERAEAMTELLLFQAKLQEESSEGPKESEGPQEEDESRSGP